MSFKECENLVGEYFKINPYPHHWLKEPLELIRLSNGVLTFFVKRGSTEVRFDLSEKDFKAYTVTKI